MIVKESDLKRIVRKLISEAPLADIFPTQVVKYSPASSLSKDPFYFDIQNRRGIDDPEYVRTSEKIFSSQKYRKNLEKLVSGWPINIYWFPVIPTHSSATEARVVISSPEVFLEESRENHLEISRVVDEWISKRDSNSSLFIVSGGETGRIAFGNTPWMALHGMFDNDEIFDDPETEKALGPAKDAGIEIYSAVQTLGRFGRRVSEIEKIFTMGSARSKYWSTEKMSLISNPTAETMRDIMNEVAVQCISPKGFRYNKEALEKETRFVKDERAKDEILETFDRVESDSSSIKENFVRSIKGKVVSIKVNVGRLLNQQQ